MASIIFAELGITGGLHIQSCGMDVKVVTYIFLKGNNGLEGVAIRCWKEIATGMKSRASDRLVNMAEEVFQYTYRGFSKRLLDVRDDSWSIHQEGLFNLIFFLDQNQEESKKVAQMSAYQEPNVAISSNDINIIVEEGKLGETTPREDGVRPVGTHDAVPSAPENVLNQFSIVPIQLDKEGENSASTAQA
ncbi:hypothetical protein BDZ45DRAFT_694818 [Acephala macrosclerotiorum]|nr:hypothetical protein BDZ45DRAFT_694818 [Acephala macrosclerotiorum]